MNTVLARCGFTFLLCVLFPITVWSQGTVYLVLGSDTGIWDGMDVSRYYCTYSLGLFTDPTRTTARVMDPSFRAGLVDSYGTPVKLTWWMMAGNIFRHATNTNVPRPNTMTFHLMKKYCGAAIRSYGDELTLHYHTFVWTDYDGDGKWYWNQAREFPESARDFDETLAEILVEEEVFPVSFRSGWETMDNAWQQRLDQILPYSLHNNWPAKRADPTEPIDNVYDWSRAPSTRIPFHPSPSDYQVPGAGRGWNVRSSYMSTADSAFMGAIFAEAARGVDQVVCLWAHLPESDFPDNIQKINTSAHLVAPLYPTVRFRYCTAVEAMQAWRRTADTTRPTVSVEETVEGTTVRWTIQTDEPLFQPEPIVAVKDRYEQYRLIPCVRLGERQWQTAEAIPRHDVAKVGIAATDTAGNCTLTFLRPLPDDVFVDDEDTSRTQSSGPWMVSQTAAWGRSSRIVTLHTGEQVSFTWTPALSQTALYNIFIQVPGATKAAQSCTFRFLQGATVLDSILIAQPLVSGSWVFLASRLLSPGDRHSLEMVASGTGQDGFQLAADVVKYSPLIRDRWLVAPQQLNAAEIVVLDTNRCPIVLENQGIEPVTVSAVRSEKGFSLLQDSLPLVVPPMSRRAVTVLLCPQSIGVVNDTLFMTSDDPHHPLLRLPISGVAREYFAIVDDRDSLAYTESGSWSFSVAQAYGSTSRYAYPAAGVSATFSARLKKGGLYDIFSIVPTTVNASLRARYLLVVKGASVDSVFIDQNVGSGSWVSLLQHEIAAGAEVKVVITDAQSTPSPGKVLRADAVRFQWIQDNSTAVPGQDAGSIRHFALYQNFPNPFNPGTIVPYQLPIETHATLKIYDLLGREVAVLVNERKTAGIHTAQFDATGLASGVYFYQLSAGNFRDVKRMVILK